MQRRAFLRVAAAGSAAAALDGVLIGLPVLDPPSPTMPSPRLLRERLVGRSPVEPGWSSVVTGEAQLVGIGWQGDSGARFEIDRRDVGGAWRRVGSAGVTDVLPDPGSDDDLGRPPGFATEPLWVGGSDELRLRLTRGDARTVDLTRIVAPQPAGSSNVAAAAVPSGPGIVTRGGWGANEGLRVSKCPSGPTYDARVRLAIVHHTVNSNSYSPGEAIQMVRSIYAYHTQSLGYCDIAYNFVIDRFGTVYEGRYGGIAEPVRGAHSIGYNTDTTGIALLGNFSGGGLTAAALQALQSLVAWKLGVHNVNAAAATVYTTTGNDVYPVGTARVLSTVIGHRDTWSTGCPGQTLYDQLPNIRASAAAIQAAAPRPSWRSWGPLGGVVTSDPATSSWQPGRLDTFVRGTDNRLWHKWYQGSWSGWESLGGVLTSAPAAASWGPDRIDVFALAGAGSLQHWWFDGAAWRGWEDLGGSLTAAPSVSAWTPGRLDVFARGTAGDVVHRYFDNGWSAWESLGGACVGAPAAVSWVSGRIDLFVRGTDNQLWHKWYQGSWSGWESLGGVLTSAPSAASWAEGRLDVFGRGTDNALWHRFYQEAWGPWESLGGVLTTGPSAVSWAPERLDVFAGGTDSQLWQRWYG